MGGGFSKYLIENLNMELNGRWFPQIVDRDCRNLYPYILHSIVLIFDPKCGGVGGGGWQGGVMGVQNTNLYIFLD